MSTRRQFLGRAVGAGTLAGIPAVPAIAGPGRHTFVLVHGTWHGGWVWRDVARLLREKGHHVVTPTCTGCGERVHLTSPDVGLETHITDISNVIRYDELDDIVLVGHSFSGLTITGVADRLSERVRRLVFFDALVPRAGRMAGVPRDPDTGAFPDWWRQRAKKFVDGYQMVMWDEYPVDMLVPPEMTRHVMRLKRLITTHPARQWTDELILNNDGWKGMRLAYVHCVGQKYRMSSDLMVGPAREAPWDFIELDAPRNAMMTHPRLVADTLVSLA